VWGTGGDEGSNIEGIKDIVLNPDVYNILRYRHNHTATGDYIETAMFIPAYAMVNHLLDERGWCNPEDAKA
jgi:hypothetical protein